MITKLIKTLAITQIKIYKKIEDLFKHYLWSILQLQITDTTKPSFSKLVIIIKIFCSSMWFLQRKYPQCQFLFPSLFLIPLSFLLIKLPFKKKNWKMTNTLFGYWQIWRKEMKNKNLIFPSKKESISTIMS